MRTILSFLLIAFILQFLILNCSKEMSLPIQAEIDGENFISLKKTFTIMGDAIEGEEIFAETFVINSEEKDKKENHYERIFSVSDFNGVFIFHLINGDGTGLNAIDDARIELNGKKVENDQHWDYENWKRMNFGFPNGKYGYEYAKYIDLNRIPIIDGENKLIIKPKTKTSGTLSFEIIFQSFPLTIVDENFDSYSDDKLPKNLPLVVNEDTDRAGWQIITSDPANDYQRIIDGNAVLAPTLPNCYMLEKNSEGYSPVYLIAWPDWISGIKGFQEAKIMIKNPIGIFHYQLIGQWDTYAFLRFDEYSNSYVFFRGEWPNNHQYLFSYEPEKWYHLKLEFDTIQDLFSVTIDGQNYGTFTSVELDPYYVHGLSWLNLFLNKNTVYVDDIKIVFTDAVIWDEWMDKNEPEKLTIRNLEKIKTNNIR